MSLFVFPAQTSGLPAGAATEAKQDSQIALLTTIDTDTSTLAAVDYATQTTLAALLTELQLKADLTETQPVSAASLPLPADAATQTTLAALLVELQLKADLTETQPVSAASLPLPADAATQTTLAALLTELQLKADLTETQPVSAASLPLPADAATQTTLAALLTELQLKADLTETQPVSAASLPLPADAATQTTSAALLTELQLKADLTETQPVSAASLPLPTGASTEATLSTLNGKVTACNTGSVTISTALPAGTNTLGNVNVTPITPVDFLDSGVVDSGSTAITVAGLTVVASLASDCTELEIVEDLGELMAITDGADVVLAYLPLGGGRVKLSISSGTTLKLASLTGGSITSGSIAINFLG